MERAKHMPPVVLGEVRYLCFLQGYAHPSLLVLHEPKPTCVGRYAALEDSCALRSLLLDLAKGGYVAAVCAVCAVRACGLVVDCLKDVYWGRSRRLI